MGDFGTQNFEGYFNLGGETAALKLNAARLEHDGYYWNKTVREWQDDHTEDRYGAHLLWKPLDDLTIELQGNYIRQDGTPNPVLNISDGTATDGSGDAFCAFFGQCFRTTSPAELYLPSGILRRPGPAAEAPGVRPAILTMNPLSPVQLPHPT